MKYAHHIYHNSKREWPQSVKTAWQVYFCMRKMTKGPVKFYYRKLDGSIRCAFGRLNNVPRKPIKATPARFDVFTYYDIERRNFRCFKTENFIGYSKTWNA